MIPSKERLPRTVRDEHLTFIQLQLGILSTALSTNSVNVDVSSSAPPFPTARRDRKELVTVG